MQGMLLSKLSAFVTVASQRHFAKAAAQLRMSPSALSQTIKSIEERLGVRLLNRTTRSVTLTPAGERLLADLQPVMAAVDEALDGVNDFRDQPGGMLRLSINRPVAAHIIAPLLPEFLAEQPDITLEIVTDDSDTDIVTERIDAGIRIGEWIEKDMIAIRIFDEFRMTAVASPHYLARHPAPSIPEQLTDHNCILRRWTKDGAIHAWEFERDGRRSQVAVRGSLIVNDLSLLLHAATDGIGIAFVPEMLAAGAVAEGKLTVVLADWAPRISGLFLYYSSRRQMPAPLRAFIAFMRRHRASDLVAAVGNIKPAVSGVGGHEMRRPIPANANGSQVLLSG
jgi:DNA-binding transcriptional LysR family regulator